MQKSSSTAQESQALAGLDTDSDSMDMPLEPKLGFECDFKQLQVVRVRNTLAGKGGWWTVRALSTITYNSEGSSASPLAVLPTGMACHSEKRD